MERIFFTMESAGLKLLFAAALVFGLAGPPLTPALAGDGDWRVSDIQGDARFRQRTQAWQPLKRGQQIPPESQIETGKSGRLLLVRPGDSIAVSPNSLFAVPKDAHRPSTRANPMTHIVQKAGTLLFKITTRPDKPFGVKTPYLAATIKGTTFTVSVKPDNAALHVSKGAVQVSSILSSQSVLVRPGQTAAVGPANGGKLHMLGVHRSKPGRSKAAKNVKKVDRKKQTARFEPDTRGTRTAVVSRTRSRKPGLKIGKTIGAKRVDIARVSNGLLFEVVPATRAPAAANRMKDGVEDSDIATPATGRPSGNPISPAGNAGPSLQRAAPLPVAAVPSIAPPVAIPPALSIGPKPGGGAIRPIVATNTPAPSVASNGPPALGQPTPKPKNAVSLAPIKAPKVQKAKSSGKKK